VAGWVATVVKETEVVVVLEVVVGLEVAGKEAAMAVAGWVATVVALEAMVALAAMGGAVGVWEVVGAEAAEVGVVGAAATEAGTPLWCSCSKSRCAHSRWIASTPQNLSWSRIGYAWPSMAFRVGYLVPI
jgi:hypothetical protein